LKGHTKNEKTEVQEEEDDPITYKEIPVYITERGTISTTFIEGILIGLLIASPIVNFILFSIADKKGKKLKRPTRKRVTSI